MMTQLAQMLTVSSDRKPTLKDDEFMNRNALATAICSIIRPTKTSEDDL
jgi:hypothetical protein